MVIKKNIIFLLIIVIFFSGCNVNTKKNLRKFITASAEGDVGTVQKYIDKGINLNAFYISKKNIIFKTTTTAYLEAVKNDQVEIVKILLDNGLNINTTLPDKRDHLAEAAFLGKYKIVSLLMKKRSDELSETSVLKAFMESCSEGHVEIVKIFINRGVEINGKYGFSDYTPLGIACYNGRLEVVKYLIENHSEKIEINTIEEALINSISGDRADVVQYLINKGIDIDFEYDTLTPLMKASSLGHTEIAEIILSYDSHINKKNSLGYSALYYAVEKFYYSTIMLLLKKGAFIDEYCHDELSRQFLDSAGKGDVEKLQKVIDIGLDIDTVYNYKHLKWSPHLHGLYPFPIMIPLPVNFDTFYSTALIEASSTGKEKAVEFLIKNGADVNIKRTGNIVFLPAIIYASGNGYFEIVKMLDKAGAEDTETAFIAAVCSGKNNNIKIIEYLVKKNPEIIVIQGTEALFLVIENNKPKSIEKLLELGVDPNVTKNHKVHGSGTTALMYAVLSKKKKNVEILIKYGADINKKNFSGDTALSLAKRYEYKSIERFLLKK